jgi:hypothetical protein
MFYMNVSKVYENLVSCGYLGRMKPSSGTGGTEVVVVVVVGDYAANQII